MELMIVISVLAIIVTAVVVNLQNVTNDAREAITKSDLRTLASAIIIYESRHQQYPEVANWKAALQNDEPRLISRVPIDPFSQSKDKYIYKLNTDAPQDKTYLLLSVGPNSAEETTVTYDEVNKNSGDDLIISNAATVND